MHSTVQLNRLAGRGWLGPSRALGGPCWDTGSPFRAETVLRSGVEGIDTVDDVHPAYP